MTRTPPRSVARTALLLTVGALSLTACGFNSPVQTQKPYQPADGVEVNLGSVAIRNLLVVATTADAPGQLAGLVVNSSSTPQTITITTPDGTSAKTQVGAGLTSQLSTGPGAVVLAKAGAPAGNLVTLKISTPTSGTSDVSVPVLLPQGYYATVTPSATPASPTATPSVTTGP